MPSGSYAQAWNHYNESQSHEKERFLVLLRDLCEGVDLHGVVSGRPRLLLPDMLFCIVYKVYSLFSSRRFTPDLRMAQANGYIPRVPHFNSVSRYLRMEFVTEILFRLIETSAQPLRDVENIFAVDSTGLSTGRRRKYYDRHKRKVQKRHTWLKLHAMCGVQTNIITCAEVSDGHANDNPFFKDLVKNTARCFKIAEVSADAGYLAAHNQRQVLLLGGIPFIAYKSNSTNYGAPKSTFWKQMLELYQERKPEFMNHYYKRNNVESTFSMLKAKFGGRLRSKSERGQINEALCKVLCHNLCVIVHSMVELGIRPNFYAEAGPEQNTPSNEHDARRAIVTHRIASLTVKPQQRPEQLKRARQAGDQADGDKTQPVLPLLDQAQAEAADSSSANSKAGASLSGGTSRSRGSKGSKAHKQLSLFS
jgi:transposase